MRAIFCDRDGVINVDHGYVHRWEDFHFHQGVPEALALLKKQGWLLVLVTNQSGIARGFYDEEAFQALTNKMQSYLKARGAEFDSIHYCPHLPDAAVQQFSLVCRCRKPGPEMFERAQASLGLSMTNSVCVGDNPTDIQAAKAAGVGKTFGVGDETSFRPCPPDECFSEPKAALLRILESSPTPR
jgi:D-glycero-D-manno-heptose 1,7-bisphosphate phosphatase